MDEEKEIIEIIKRVLEFKGLQLGNNEIIKFHSIKYNNKGDLLSYQIKQRGLFHDFLEDILVFSSSLEIDKSVIDNLINQSTSKNIVLVSIQKNFDKIPDGNLYGKEVKCISFNEFFNHLCELPESLIALILGKARYDFDWGDYHDRFQKRALKVLNNPFSDLVDKNQVMSADDYFLNWAKATRKRHPVILLGERGSGKTWQLLHLCEQLLEKHKNNPWNYGPALFFNLMNETSNLSAYGNTIPFFPEAIIKAYSIRYLWGIKLAEAFLYSGHTIMCLDGFEEINKVVLGEEADATEFLQRVCGALQLGSRFIISSRLSHFGSLKHLLSTQAWPGRTVEDSFEVVQLLPFNQEVIKTYITAVEKLKDNKVLNSSLKELILAIVQYTFEDSEPTKIAISNAIKTCMEVPALLKEIVDYSVQKNNTEIKFSELIETALIRATIDYNLRLGKAFSKYSINNCGKTEEFEVGTEKRVDLLCELSWYYGIRNTDHFNFNQIPQYIQNYYRLYHKGIRDEIRTHTLLEIVENSIDQVHFSIRFPKESSSINLNDDLRREFRALKLASIANNIAPIGTTSVSGAYLIAKYISENLKRISYLPHSTETSNSLLPIDRIRVLGELPLGLESAFILRELLDREKIRTIWKQKIYDVQNLKECAKNIYKDCASKEDYSVFSKCLRYLGHNLEIMNLLSMAERQEIDPWCDEEVNKIIVSDNSRVSMSLIPPPPAGTVPTSLLNDISSEHLSNRSKPFLLGIHEITNQNFAEFLSTAEGETWRVEKMTIAGGDRFTNLSPNAIYANEYYLYFWEDIGTLNYPILQIKPLDEHLLHPVVYVSWYAACAYCNWLTKSDKQGKEVYGKNFNENKFAHLGYRLPTAKEWSWAARGGNLNIDFPWELYPIVLSEKEIEFAKNHLQDNKNREEEDVLNWLKERREIYMKIIRSIPKDHIPVLSDPFNCFGLSGMMGNVKEWCHDDNNSGKQKVILGATTFLGQNSFHYNYGMFLFPQNTNPDVGFRIARSLSDYEIEKLLNKQESLKKLF